MIAATVFDFLEDLKTNNNREWFQSHQDRYAEFKKEYKNFAEGLIKKMSKHDPALEPLEFKDVSFRINRDIRFTKDKSPYKTNMGVWLCSGGKKTNLAGYYVHIEKGKSFLAGGLYNPEATDLKKVRREISGFYEDLEEILNDNDFKAVYGDLDRNENNALKSAPKGFEKDDPAIEYLKLKSFTASCELSEKLLNKNDFLKEITDKLVVLKPLIDFINRGLTTEF